MLKSHISDQSKAFQTDIVQTYTAESRLRHPRRFLKDSARDLRGSRGAIQALVKRNLTQRYRYSSLGLVWVIAPPIVTAAALSIGQKANIIGTGTSSLYAIFGVMMAQTFLESLNHLRSLFVSNQQLLARDNTPLEAFIVSSLSEEFFNTAMRLGVVLLAFIYSIKPTYTTVGLIVPGFVGLMLAGGGIGLLLAPFSALKGDFDKAMMVFPWIFFAITPVFFRGESIEILQKIYSLNPAAWVFDSIRHAAYGWQGSLGPVCLVFPVGLLLCLLGSLWCRLSRPHVIERTLH